MNILSVNNFKFSPVSFNEKKNNKFLVPQLGLKMAQPLTKDTISFSGKFIQTKKTCGDLKGACTSVAGRNIIRKHIDAHIKNYELFKKRFAGKLSDEEAKRLFTLLNRLKGIFSLQLKTASLGIGGMKVDEILQKINDVSGFCFVLEDAKSYEEFVNIFSDMIRHGEVNPVEVEYHRLPPVYKKNGASKNHDSLNPAITQKLKNTIYDVKNPTYQLWKDVDSRSGYSGLHVTIKNKDGTKSEIQIITRAMADLKHYENLYYKFRNGKPLDPKYTALEPILMPLKPKDLENLTPEEAFLQKALTKYTQEAYTERLVNPYDVDRPFLRVSEAKSLTSKEKEVLAPFDFNKIKVLVDAYDTYAKEV